MNRIIATLAIFFFLSGCGNWDAIYRKHDFTERSAITDIKSRVILSAGPSEERKVCAEPSPDAMTAYAAELATKADIASKGTAGLTSAYQGAASYVGMRTQSIQLLRDQLYRLCEAYMNGAIDEAEYEMLLRRNQRYTVGLMAIETLTQPVHTPVISITSTSTAGLYSDVKEATTALDQATTEKAQLEASAGTSPSEEQKQKLQALSATIEALKQRITSGNAAIASGSTAVHSSPIATRTAPSSESINAAKDIAIRLIDVSDSGYVCLDFFKTLGGNTPSSGPNKVIYDYCDAYLKSTNANIKAGSDSTDRSNLVNLQKPVGD